MSHYTLGEWELKGVFPSLVSWSVFAAARAFKASAIAAIFLEEILPVVLAAR